MQNKDAIQLIEAATSPAILFGSDPRKKFLELSKATHPDYHKESRSLKAFQRLNEFYQKLNGKTVIPPAFIPVPVG